MVLVNSRSVSQRLFFTASAWMLASTESPPPNPTRPRNREARKKSGSGGRRRAAAAGDSMAWPSMSFQYRRSAVPRFLKGMKVIHRAQGEWGVGHILAVSDDPPRLSADFPGRPGGPVMLSSRDAALARFRFAAQAQVLLADGTAARVLRALPGPPDDLYRYTVEVAGKKPQIRSEADLRAPAPREGPAEQLASGRWGTPEDFHLRAETVRLDLERRADALGALFASRVYVKPHQVSVVHQILSAPRPRFVLADEVGLGKTIEAGLVLSGLLHAGLVKRCLVVAPSHLTVQWLAELFHKFNLLFTLMDPDRARDDREAAEAEAPEEAGSPWARHPLVITSLEWLSRSREETKAAAGAGWDLVIVDEAHHLRGGKAYEVAQALARSTWGLLLLTGTPLQLDPAEYHALLRLVDPAPAATEQELRARLARQGDLSAEVRALLGGDAAAAERIAALFPDDPALRELRGKPLLAHRAEGSGLSARLLRNRRAVLGGFTPRRLTKIPVELTDEERKLEHDVRRALAHAKLPSGAVLASLLRRMGSSPPALAAGLSAAGEKKLAQRALALAKDSKLEAFQAFLAVLGAGVGVFTEPVGGLDPVLEGVEPSFLALASTDDAERWEEMTRELASRVSAARAEVARAYDPLLDLRSCDFDAVRALAERGAHRLGARAGVDGDAATSLQAVATHLERRLEAVTVEAARRVGLEVDVEVDVLPGEVSFHVGPELKVDALAGFDLEEDRVVLGSFQRDVAVRHEEHESFATGHPLVEALFGWLRDGELGRATVARAHFRGTQGAALDARYLVALPEPADLAQGARVPSRRAARHLEEMLIRVVVRLDGRGGARVEDGLAAQLESAQLEPVPAPEGGPPAAFVQAVELGLRAAEA